MPIKNRKRIAITMGDAAGIGPEVGLKALKNVTIPDDTDLLLIGSYPVWQAAAQLVEFDRRLVLVKNADTSPAAQDTIMVLDGISLNPDEYQPGHPNPSTGSAAGLAIQTAAQLALSGEVQAIVTGPIQKDALNSGGFHFPGHTEMLQTIAGVPDVVMLMYSNKFSTALVSTHVALTDTVKALAEAKILFVIEQSYQFLKHLAVSEPRIAVAAFNPHAGEKGMFGQEEIQIISPAIQKAQQQGLPVWGPYPPDTVFVDAMAGKYQLVVAMYHDQGLIPFKLVAFDEGVNVTLGLPFWRTSPDHGTALNIAWQNRASASSMEQAIRLALKLIA